MARAEAENAHAAYLGRARFPSLDGLRCLSILPVIWHHGTPRQLEGVLGRGPLGVHLFFAISGFLITALLLRERARAGTISLRGFFARRSLRIFPLYYAVLALYVARAWLMPEPDPVRSHFFQSLPYYATYTGNWFVDYGVAHPILFAFSWSLATEEQFYLVWPWVVGFARRAWGPALFMASLLVLDLVTEQGLLATVLAPGGRAEWIVTSISAPICLGSLLALALHSRPAFSLLHPALGSRFGAPLAFAALAALVAIDGAPLWGIHVAMTALVGAVVIRPDHGLCRWLDAAPMVFVGSISYGAYLLHVSAISVAKQLVPGGGAAVVFLVALPITLVAAWASLRWFERPFLALRDRFRAPAR